MNSLLERLQNPTSKNQLEQDMREIALKELDLPIKEGPLNHAERAALVTLTRLELYGSPDDQQSLNSLLVIPMLRQLKEYARAKQVDQLTDDGIKVEIQPFGMNYHIVASIQY